MRKSANLLWGPSFITDTLLPASSVTDSIHCIKLIPDIQVAILSINSKSFYSELKGIFPDREWKAESTTYISTMQKPNMELARYDPEVDREKDVLLENVGFVFFLFLLY
jgi:hypothetical protein